MDNLMNKANQWLEHRFWWWVGSALVAGVWMAGSVKGWWNG